MPAAAEGAEERRLIPADVEPPHPDSPEGLDFLQLREAYAARADFAERCESNAVESTVLQAFAHRLLEDVLELSAPVLERCPVWLQIHLLRTAALATLGRQDEARLQGSWIKGIMASVLRSGDGRTIDTPLVTISITEEEGVMQQLDLDERSRTLIETPRRVHRVRASDSAGTEGDIFFDPAWHFFRLEQGAALAD